MSTQINEIKQATTECRWYIDPLGDNHTNYIITREKRQTQNIEEDSEIGKKCSDGIKRNLWSCDYKFIVGLLGNKKKDGLKFDIFMQMNDGEIRRWVPFSQKNKKIVFIAHQIRGENMEENIKNVLVICEDIHKNHPNIIPFFPSLPFLRTPSLTPEDEDRKREAVLEFFYRKTIDEVWLFGKSISQGMLTEILAALMKGIPVVAKTKETKEALQKLYGM